MKLTIIAIIISIIKASTHKDHQNSELNIIEGDFTESWIKKFQLQTDEMKKLEILRSMLKNEKKNIFQSFLQSLCNKNSQLKDFLKTDSENESSESLFTNIESILSEYQGLEGLLLLLIIGGGMDFQNESIENLFKDNPGLEKLVVSYVENSKKESQRKYLDLILRNHQNLEQLLTFHDKDKNTDSTLKNLEMLREENQYDNIDKTSSSLIQNHDLALQKVIQPAKLETIADEDGEQDYINQNLNPQIEGQNNLNSLNSLPQGDDPASEESISNKNLKPKVKSKLVNEFKPKKQLKDIKSKKKSSKLKSQGRRAKLPTTKGDYEINVSTEVNNKLESAAKGKKLGVKNKKNDFGHDFFNNEMGDDPYTNLSELKSSDAKIQRQSVTSSKNSDLENSTASNKNENIFSDEEELSKAHIPQNVLSKPIQVFGNNDLQALSAKAIDSIKSNYDKHNVVNNRSQSFKSTGALVNAESGNKTSKINSLIALTFTFSQSR